MVIFGAIRNQFSRKRSQETLRTPSSPLSWNLQRAGPEA